MTPEHETIGTVLLLGVPLTIIIWHSLPLSVVHAAAAAGLTLGLGVIAYLTVHWLHGFAAGVIEHFGGGSDK